MTTDSYILPLTPQTKVEVTQNTYMIFKIPETCYKGRGKKGCAKWRKTGFCEHTLSKEGRYKKQRLRKYNDYKAAVLTAAKKVGFVLPNYGFSIYFYVPIPKRWNVEDRKIMHGQPHHRKPDIDNFLKAVFDSLTFTDEQISQLSGLGKFWVDTKQGEKRNDPIGDGWIEIKVNQPVYNPFNVEFIDQSKVASLKQTTNYKKRKEKGDVRGYVADGAHSKKQKTLFNREDKIK